MNYILEMQNKNIKFDIISKDAALDIMMNEFSYYQLMEYSRLFEKYVNTDKRGKFVQLDFSQMYYLAVIDEQLRKLILNQCLELEKFLKLRLIVFFNDKEEYVSHFLREYILQDEEYLKETYNELHIDILHYKYSDVTIDKLELSQFLDVIQFGTLERFWIFCCHKCMLFSAEKIHILRECFTSTRTLRNASAHNNSILSNMNVRVDLKERYLASKMIEEHLKESGLGQKTIATNMSKRTIRDICNYMYLCREVESDKLVINNGEEWNTFFRQISIGYSDAFSKHESLKSAYTFLRNVNTIFLREFEKKGC